MICNYNDCCGCLACYDICPVNAITISDNEGFYRSIIDNSKCIGCGKCKKVCTALNARNQYNVIKCFAVWSKNRDLQFQSSSGGFCTELAREFCRIGGVAAGACFDSETLSVRHILCEREKDIERLRGSKYVYSNMMNIYRKIAGGLDKKLLFVGVPCQVHAVQNFCRVSGISTDNLFTVELLCRGGASPLCFRQHLKSITRRKIYDVTFRGGNYDCWFTVYGNKNKLIFQDGQYQDAYFASFMRHSIFQERCYQCPYTGIHRTGDITTGDFWGLDENILELAGKRGVNVVLVNNAKGAKLLKIIRDKINIIERELDEAIPENETLIRPTDKPQEYANLWELIRTKGFSKAYRIIYPVSLKARIKSPLRRLKRYIKLKFM